MAKKANNQIGELNIGVGITTTDMKAGLDKAKVEAVKGGKDIGQAIEKGVSDGAKAAGAGVEREVEKASSLTLKGIGSIRTMLTRIIAPIAIAKAAVEIIASFDRARAAATLLQADIDKVVLSYAKLGEAAAKKVSMATDPNAQALDAIKEQAKAAKDALTEQANEAVANIQQRSPGGAFWAMLTGGDTLEEMFARFDAATERIDKLAMKNLERERERQRKKGEDDFRYARIKGEEDRRQILETQRLKELDDENERADAIRSIQANRRANEQTYQNQRREERRERIEDRRELAAEIAKAVRDAVREATKETLSEIHDLLKAQVASTRQVEQQTRAVKNGMYRGGDR